MTVHREDVVAEAGVVKAGAPELTEVACPVLHTLLRVLLLHPHAAGRLGGAPTPRY